MRSEDHITVPSDPLTVLGSEEDPGVSQFCLKLFVSEFAERAGVDGRLAHFLVGIRLACETYYIRRARKSRFAISSHYARGSTDSFGQPWSFRIVLKSARYFVQGS